jgi:hypothetical protein
MSDPYFTLSKKINSKSIRYLNVRNKARKVLEKTGVNLADIKFRDGFLDKILKA